MTEKDTAKDARAEGAQDETRDEEAQETRAVHPVQRAAERKLKEVEEGRYMDVARHQQIRQEELGDSALSPEQRATGALGSETMEDGAE